MIHFSSTILSQYLNERLGDGSVPSLEILTLRLFKNTLKLQVSLIKAIDFSLFMIVTLAYYQR